MIIVSQNKELILNFKSIQDIRIEEYGTHEKGKKIYKILAGNFEGYATWLGTYKTIERAKEVLEEIYSSYTALELVNIPNMKFESTITAIQLKEAIAYKMPEG